MFKFLFFQFTDFKNMFRINWLQRYLFLIAQKQDFHKNQLVTKKSQLMAKNLNIDYNRLPRNDNQKSYVVVFWTEFGLKIVVQKKVLINQRVNRNANAYCLPNCLTTK